MLPLHHSKSETGLVLTLETMKKRTNNIASVTVATATDTMCLAINSILGLNIDASKTDFCEVYNLLNKEKNTYYGMMNHQAEKGNFEKADKYSDINWELARALKPFKAMFEASL